MKSCQSELNESTIDIFILSASNSVVPLFTESLERKGYRLTLFTDAISLREKLKMEKPNLLICDATTLDTEAFETCRCIKADDDLGIIPVLILTNVSSLSDLFHILDCNADNLLPLPLDLQFSLSLIDNMLRKPVEHQIPDDNKLQFKIRHDDQTYTVAANRRKLLELLLSSFEIAANNSSELVHVKIELQTLSESVSYLEDRVSEQSRLINTIKATLHQKEQKISILNLEIEEKRKLLVQKTGKAVIFACDEDGHSLAGEKKGIDSSSCFEIESLRKQVSQLSDEVDTAKKNLDIVQTDLDEEKMHCTSLECTLELLEQQKELAEKSFLSIKDVYEQQVSAIENERARVTSAEQEIKTLMQAKTQSEQELTQIIERNTEANNQQAADLNRMKSELELEVNQRISIENQLGILQLDKEKTESLLRSSLTTLTDQLDDLRVQLENTRTAFENEEKTTKELKEKLAEIQAENENTRLRIKGDLETDKVTIIKQKHELDEITSILKTVETSLNSMKIQNKVLIAELNLANQKGSQSDQQVRLLTDEVNRVRSELDTERRLHQEADKKIEPLMQTIRCIEQDLHSSVEERNKLNELLENERKMRINFEDNSKTVIEEQKYLVQELCPADGEQACIQKQQFSIKETSGEKNDTGQTVTKKSMNLPVIIESSFLPPPDIQQSPVSENEQTSSKPLSQITEVPSRTITDIIDIFCNDPIIEDDNLS